MRCPYCHRDNDRVLDTRASEDGFAIRRRRICNGCRKRFTTYERLEELSLSVVKKNQNREPFSREKIRKGVEKACWKRPISAEQINSVVTLVESEIIEIGDPEVPSDAIGELVMKHLASIDKVAYIRFASIYRDFRDVADFVREVTPYL